MTIKAGTMVATKRKSMRMTQEELGAQLGRSRWWVARLESNGERGGAGGVHEVTPAMWSKIAAVLDLDLHELLVAADVPTGEWPIDANVSSINASVSLDGLSDEQAKLIIDLTNQLRKGNTHDKSGENPR